MPRHEIVGMLPARQRLDPVEPSGDVFVLGGNIETELLGRIVEVGCQGKVGDGRALEQNEPPPVEMAGEPYAVLTLDARSDATRLLCSSF